VPADRGVLAPKKGEISSEIPNGNIGFPCYWQSGSILQVCSHLSRWADCSLFWHSLPAAGVPHFDKPLGINYHSANWLMACYCLQNIIERYWEYYSYLVRGRGKYHNVATIDHTNKFWRGINKPENRTSADDGRKSWSQNKAPKQIKPWCRQLTLPLKIMFLRALEYPPKLKSSPKWTVYLNGHIVSAPAGAGSECHPNRSRYPWN